MLAFVAVIGLAGLVAIVHHMMTEGRRGRRWAGLSRTSNTRRASIGRTG